MHNVIKEIVRSVGKCMRKYSQPPYWLPTSQRFGGSIPDTNSEMEIDHCRIYNCDIFHPRYCANRKHIQVSQLNKRTANPGQILVGKTF